MTHDAVSGPKRQRLYAKMPRIAARLQARKAKAALAPEGEGGRAAARFEKRETAQEIFLFGFARNPLKSPDLRK
ncbi:MAG: hypothetical protein WCE61_10735 [Candidatus Acidiferrum sp.]